MNYIYFNEKGRLKKHNIDDLYAGSANVDTIYIFADFDNEETSDYEVSLMFKRYDDLIIGPVECLPDTQDSPLTGEPMRCFSFLLGADVLAVAGTLGITARYHSTYVDPITELEEEAIKATGMVTANVNATVPLQGGTSTVLLNLNRKIVSVNEKLIEHIDTYNGHNHNTLYYQKEESELMFAKSLEVDTGGNIILFSGNGTALSSVKIPTVIQTTPVGNLVFNGTGRFLLPYINDPNKKYLIHRVGSPVITIGLFWSIMGPDQDPDELEYEHTYQNDYETPTYLETINDPKVFDLDLISNAYSSDGADRLGVEVDYKLDGVAQNKIHNFYVSPDDRTVFGTFGVLKIGFFSTGYFQVYELED